MAVFKALFDKTKERTDYRPDYFHLNLTTNMTLHGEFDETSSHEDDHNRLQQIASQTGCVWERTYYFRFMTHLDNRAFAFFRRKRNQRGDCCAITSRDKGILDEVVAYVKDCLVRMGPLGCVYHILAWACCVSLCMLSSDTVICLVDSEYQTTYSNFLLYG